MVVLAGLGRGGVCRCSVFESGVEGNEGEGRDGEEEERIGSLVLRRHPLRLQCHCSSSGDRNAFPGAQTAQNARTCSTRPRPPPPPPRRSHSPARTMDVRHSHGTDVFVVRSCYEDDAADLIALGGAHSVEVLLLVSPPPPAMLIPQPVLAPSRNTHARQLQASTLAPA